MRTYALENRGRAPLYEYLYRCIRGDILDGTLTAGERLPSKRALAEHLHISVMTVEGAYQQLEAEGYVKQCADKYIGLGQCKDHGAVLIRLRFQPTDDGIFEVVLVRQPQNPLQLQAIIKALLTMSPDEQGLVTSYRTSRLRITCRQELPWTLDGEYGGAPKTAEIENCSRAVSIVYGK